MLGLSPTLLAQGSRSSLMAARSTATARGAAMPIVDRGVRGCCGPMRRLAILNSSLFLTTRYTNRRRVRVPLVRLRGLSE